MPICFYIMSSFRTIALSRMASSIVPSSERCKSQSVSAYALM